MQTLKTARLTSNPASIPTSSSSSAMYVYSWLIIFYSKCIPTTFNKTYFFRSAAAIQKTLDAVNRPPAVRASGILRHRTLPAPTQETAHHLDADPKTTELMARFFISQGIPFECAHEPAFLELMKHVDPNCVIPPTNVTKKLVDKISTSSKPQVNYTKTVGPLSVTIDICGDEDEKYLAFSIHYFEDLYERKNAIYLRKLLLTE